jgi:PAS domain S-box-containing protein
LAHAVSTVGSLNSVQHTRIFIRSKISDYTHEIMNIISILHFSSFLVYVLLIIYVIEKGADALLNRLCAVLIATFALISFAYGLANSANSLSEALLFVNTATVGWCIGPMAGLWFYLALTHRTRIMKNRIFVVLSLLVPSLFIYLQWSGIMPLGAVRTDWGWAAIWTLSPYAWVFLAYLTAMALMCCYLVIRYLLESTSSNQRKQAWLMLITGVIAIVPLCVGVVLFQRFEMRSIPQGPDILLMIWVIGIVLAISKYGLMSITPAIAYEQILRTMSDSLMLLDKQGKIAFANRATRRLLGERNEDLAGEDFSNFLESADLAMELLDSTMQTGDTHRELSFRSKHGRESQVLVSASAVRGPANGLRGFIISAADITERKRAEAQLKAHEELINRILESMPSAVLLLNEEGRVVLANRLFYESLSKTQDEVIGRLVPGVIYSDNLLRMVSAFQSGLINSGQTEFRYRVNGSNRIYIIDIISMLNENLLLVFNDVTEERERQDRLYLTDRLASIGEMAAGIAHELNNPLTSVIGLSKMLIEQDSQQDSKDDLNAIYGEALRASMVVNNLLTFARKHPPIRQIARIQNVIDDVLRLRSYEHKVNNIHVEKIFENGLPEVVIDYYQMQQVFLNIILNAEHAMTEVHKGGKLIIEAKKINGSVVLSFSDNGPGIARENIKRIFDPFFTTKEVGKGTGLGLSICYGIITNHGGRIYAESELGRGSTFFVELPVFCPSPALAQVVHYS